MQRLLNIERSIDVIPNFFTPRPPTRSREQVREELGMGSAAMVLHCSNLRPVKRIDLLLETVARIHPRESFKLVILAGEDFSPYADHVRRLGIQDKIIVREKVNEIEDYLQAADLALFTSDSESFCLGLVEAMYFACPGVSTRVGGVPEVIDDGVTGLLVPPGDVAGLAHAVEYLIQDRDRRATMGRDAQQVARVRFSAQKIVPQYESLYRRVCSAASSF